MVQKAMETPQMQVVEKTVDIPQLQIVEQIVEVPEVQMVEDTQTSESLGIAPVRQTTQAENVEVVEIGAPLPTESSPPIFFTAPVLEVLQLWLSMYNMAPALTVAYVDLVTKMTVTPIVFPTTVPMSQIATATVLKTFQLCNGVCYPQKTEEIPQVRQIDKVVGVPVVWQRQAPTIQTDVPQIQCLEPLVDVPVV